MYLIQFTYVSIKLRWFNTGVSTQKLLRGPNEEL